MTRSGQGAAQRRRNIVVLRGAGFALAVALGAIAVWLIVTSQSQKSLEIGILTGLWGLLLGAFSVFGSRSTVREAQPQPLPQPPPPAAVPPRPVETPGGQGLDLRKIGELERAVVAAARREFQADLQEMLRREVTGGVAEEVSRLRAEVAALRNELVEKVGGQLRLERIETTRLIGSDLEALQQELRELRQRNGLGTQTVSDMSITHRIEGLPLVNGTANQMREAEIVVERVNPPEQARPAARPPARPAAVVPPRSMQPETTPIATVDLRAMPRIVTDLRTPRTPVEDAVVEPEVTVPEPEAVATETEAEAEVVTDAGTAEAAVDAEVEPAEVEPAQAPAAEPVADRFADAFAAMPRLTPFTDFDLDPLPPTPSPSGAHEAAEDSQDSDDSGRGRRRRDDDSNDDVLARILARERR